MNVNSTDMLTVVPSPHRKDPANTTSIMLTVIVALMPALIASVVLFGFRALLLTAVCVVSCVVFEYLFRRVVKRYNTIGDLSAVVTGILLAYNLPVNFPVWMAVIGCFVAIVVVKQLFGGIGQNFANPAITARVVLLISFAKPMSDWVAPSLADGKITRVAGATPLQLMAEGQSGELPSVMDMLFGLRGGCLGETCIIALVVGGVFLMVKKIISPAIPLCFLGTVFFLSWALGADPVYQILSGGVVLGAFFMATDYSTSPSTTAGRILFGIGCGLFTVLIRLYGSYPEGVSFAILLMNIINPHIGRLTRTRPFGGKRKVQKAA